MIVLAMALLQASGEAAESFRPPLPAGFKVGYTAVAAGQSIEERVPASESVNDWTRMITVQHFNGLARVGVVPFLQQLGARMLAACPDATVSPVGRDPAAGLPTASLRADCPMTAETGKPETMFARAFEGAVDLYLVQYAFRSVPTAAEVAAARAYLAGVRLCAASAPCP